MSNGFPLAVCKRGVAIVVPSSCSRFRAPGVGAVLLGERVARSERVGQARSTKRASAPSTHMGVPERRLCASAGRRSVLFCWGLGKAGGGCRGSLVVGRVPAVVVTRRVPGPSRPTPSPSRPRPTTPPTRPSRPPTTNRGHAASGVDGAGQPSFGRVRTPRSTSDADAVCDHVRREAGVARSRGRGSVGRRRRASLRARSRTSGGSRRSSGGCRASRGCRGWWACRSGRP